MPASATRSSGVEGPTGGLSTPDGVTGLLAEPHHDTGPAHLMGERAPGAELTARLWVPAARCPEHIFVRQVIDGEPVFSPLARVGATPAGAWWEGAVRLVNPINRYRFLLLTPGEREPCTWYHAAGTADHDVPDSTDFAVLARDDGPQWVPDAVVYEIFPDRFGARTDPSQRRAPHWAEPHDWLDEPPASGPAAARAWYGGDLDGVVDHLDYIQGLGANTVYLTPVFPAASTHRYDATSFERVDELLGGREALARLSAALHARGMRLVLDLTTNHTGVTHEWFRAAVADPDSPEAGFYFFEHHPDVYASWMGVPTLPKLDHRADQLRDRLLRGPGSVTARWLRPPVSADGWRIDVANMTGRRGAVDLAHRVAADMRATMRDVEAETGAQLWLVAEHGHDASRDLEGPGWHGVMNYKGFTWPLWTWLVDPDPAARPDWLGIPVPFPRLGGGQVVHGLRAYAAHLPASALGRSMNLLCSHDTPRLRTAAGSRDAHLVAATALFASPGVPTVFSGDELGATGRTGEHSRTTMPWRPDGAGRHSPDELEDRGSWGEVDRQTLARYQHLAARRRELVALRRGGMRWVAAEEDLLAFTRTHPEGDVLVLLARAATGPVRLPLARLPARRVREAECFDGMQVRLLDDGAPSVEVRASGPGSALLPLDPDAP